MFIFVAVAMASCGDDDKDEPDLPDASFLYGTWEYNSSGENAYQYNTIELSDDGSFNAQVRGKRMYQQPTEYILIGKWTYKNGKLSIKSSAYTGDSFFSRFEFDYDIFYDDHINKLIVSESGDVSYNTPIRLSGQYIRAN